MNRLLLVAVCMALVAASCASDSTSGVASAKPFCDLAIAQEFLGDDLDIRAADLDPFIEAAPGSLRSDVERIQEFFVEVEEAESSGGEEAFVVLLGAGADPELTDAFDNLDRYMTDECGLDSDSDGDAAGDTSVSDSAGVSDSTDDSDDSAPVDSSGCAGPVFSGEISSEGDGSDAPFSLTDGDIESAQAFGLVRGVSYTVYLADYDLGDQTPGIDTITAHPGQVVITVFATTPDQSEIVIGEPYEATFVIMDSGGGASGNPVDPVGTIMFNSVADDRICFDIDFTDSGKMLRGTVNAEVIGSF